MTAKPNIVIVGGGYAGVKVAQSLEKSLHQTHQIILIERKSHFWHSIGSLRSMAEPNFDQKLFIPYDKIFKFSGKIIHATVTTIHKNELIVSTETEWGTHVPFEYLVIATGSNYPKPAKLDSSNKNEAEPEIQTQREAVQNAQKILIIGGGPIGIELAGEIASVHGNKDITLVHSEERLLTPNFPKKLGDNLKKQLEALNVKVVLGEKVIIPEGGLGKGTETKTLYTDKGTQITADVQFFAGGASPNTAIVETLDSSLLEEGTRLVKVSPTLQIAHDNYKHIFAVGDITNVKETKLAYRAGLQADILSKNIEALVATKKLTDYKPGPEAIFVTIGKTGGAGLMPLFGGVVVGSFMVKTLKGKNLFVDRYWKEMTGQAPPS